MGGGDFPGVVRAALHHMRTFAHGQEEDNDTYKKDSSTVVSGCGGPKPGVRAFVREAAKYTSMKPILVNS